MMSYWLTTSMKSADRRKRALKLLDSKDSTLFLPNDKVWVSGKFNEDFVLISKDIDCKYYESKVSVYRLSGEVDDIPIIVSDKVVPDIADQPFKNRLVEIGGEFQSVNTIGEDKKGHLKLFIFANFIGICDDIYGEQENNIYLEGYICKPPIFRRTPLRRIITELLIAVNTPNPKKSFYIPCIVWGQLAEDTSTLCVGDHIAICGRAQSREYFKRDDINPDSGVMKTAYEISVIDVEINEESGSL